MVKRIFMLLAMVLVFVTFGCSQQVPPGYVGAVMTPGGIDAEILPPGNHTCWGRDKLILIDTSEIEQTEKMNILCKDDLNFRFDLKVRATILLPDNNHLEDFLKTTGAYIKWGEKSDRGALYFEKLYEIYVKAPARTVARRVVSKYTTTQIRDKRGVIEKDIRDQILAEVKGTPVKITYITTSNFDYPDVITKAVEKKREREIQVEEEEATQALELLKMRNRKALAEEAIVVRAKEAEAEAVYNKILGHSLTAEYLTLRSIERDMVLYNNVQAGDKVIITDGNVSPLVNVK
jgi:hypothetical protein